MKPRKPWVDNLAYGAARMAATVISAFPLEAGRRFMRGMGSVWFYAPGALKDAWWVIPPIRKFLTKLGAHRLRAEDHIRRSFPEFDERRISEIALASMRHWAMLFGVEMFQTPRLIRPDTWARHVRLAPGLGDAIRILLSKRGCIMCTAHYGSFELLGYTLARLGFDITAVMRPLDNPKLNAMLLDAREAGGLKLLYKKGATRSAEDVLREGGALCFIADQNAGSKGVFVDFFGRPASTYKSIGLLAMEHDVPIIVGCARRVSERFDYEIELNRIIEPEEWRGHDDPLRWVTQEFSTAMEEFIRKAPEQYLWMHRRWKSRPKGEAPGAFD